MFAVDTWLRYINLISVSDFRFIPSDEPKTTVFNGDGINVDVSFYKEFIEIIKGFVFSPSLYHDLEWGLTIFLIA